MPNIPLKLDMRNKKSYGYWVGITPPPFQTLAQLPTCCIWASKIHLDLFKDEKRISALFNNIFVQWKNDYHEFHSINRCSLLYIDYHMTFFCMASSLAGGHFVSVWGPLIKLMYQQVYLVHFIIVQLQLDQNLWSMLTFW